MTSASGWPDQVKTLQNGDETEEEEEKSKLTDYKWGNISMTLLGPTSGDIQTLRRHVLHIIIIRPSIPFPANILVIQ